MSTHDDIDNLSTLEEKIHKHVGYVKKWQVYPLSDDREMFWSLGTDIDRHLIKFCPTKEKLLVWLKEGDDSGDCYSNILIPDGIYRGAEITAIEVDTQTDGNLALMVLRNDREIKLIKLEPEVREASNGAINGASILGLVPTLTSLLDPPSVVFVRTTTGSDETGDGTTEETAYRSTERAMKDITARPPSKSHCLIDFDGAGEVGRQFLVRKATS
jgi:hypothetical protein